MTAVGHDSLGTRSTFEVGGSSYVYYSLARAGAKLGDCGRLPFSMKVLLENLLRFEDGRTVTVDDIQALNPELRRWTTPVRTKDYELKVPAGTSGIVRDWLAQSNAADLAPLRWHTVKRGETLLSIARKLKVSRADLAEANYLSIRSGVKAGQQLIIPREPQLLLAARAEPPAPPVETRRADAVVAAASVAPRAEKTEQARLYHRVRRGDTLYGIARLYNTTVAALKTWNRLRTSAIHPGQRLMILTSRTARSENN